VVFLDPDAGVAAALDQTDGFVSFTGPAGGPPHVNRTAVAYVAGERHQAA
jgi:hypothetical protein